MATGTDYKAAIELAGDGQDPQITCVICSRSRQDCPTPGQDSCLQAGPHQDAAAVIAHLALEVEKWAACAYTTFEALEAAYTGKATRCGWCQEHFPNGINVEHPMQCDKNPIAKRLRAVTNQLQALQNDMVNQNIGDIALWLDNIVLLATSPITP